MNSIERKEFADACQDWKQLTEAYATARHELAGEKVGTHSWQEAFNGVASARAARDAAYVRKIETKHAYHKVC